MRVCYRVVPTVLLLNVWKQRNKLISHPDLTLFDVGDLGSRLETSTPKTLPNSPPGMEKSFSKRAHFCTWKKIGLKQFKSAAKASYSYQLLQHNEIIVNHRLYDEVLQQLGYRKKKYDKHGTFSSALSTWSSQLLLIQTSVISRKIYHLYSPIKQEPTGADILSEPAVFVFDVAYGALVSAPTCL